MQQSTDTKCPFCQQNTADTNEHIPPKCIFIPPLPANLITVPGCQECNNLYSRHEELFRVAVFGLLERYDITPDGLTQKVLGSVNHNKKLRDWFLSNPKTAWRSSPGGVVYEQLLAIEFKPQQVESTEMIVNKIVRGLYYLKFSSCIPTEYGIEIIWFYELEAQSPEFAEMLMHSTMIEREIGDAFAYTYTSNPGHSGSSVWLLAFYGYVLFVAIIQPQSKLDSIKFARSILH